MGAEAAALPCSWKCLLAGPGSERRRYLPQSISGEAKRVKGAAQSTKPTKEYESVDKNE